jgi:Predicted acyltransferases
MQRIPQLDGLRGVAILMVFATHALSIPGMWMGVDLFFVLSGYLITGILLRLKEHFETGGYWRPFYLRRAKRILPPFIGFLLFVVVVFAPRWKNVWLWYIFFGANFPLALGRVPLQSMTPLWSLAVEEQFYWIWPAIVLFCEEATLRKITLGILVVAPILRAVATPLFSNHFPIYCLTPFRVDTLAFGAFIAASQAQDGNWIDSNQRSAAWGTVVSVALLAALSFIPSFRTGANNVVFNMVGYSLSVVIFGGMLICALGARGIFRRLLTMGPLRYIGRISYTFYLYHVAILVLVARLMHVSWAIAPMSFVVTGAVASLSWYALESPILKARASQAPPRLELSQTA